MNPTKKNKVTIEPCAQINTKEIQPPIDLEKCVNIFLKHFSTKILLELIKALSINSLSFTILLFAISLNLQSHVVVISSKLIPLYEQPLSHKSASGYIYFILSFKGISFFNGLSKSKHISL